MFFKKPNRPSDEATNNNRSKIRRKKVVVVKSNRNQDENKSQEEENHEDVTGLDLIEKSHNGDFEYDVSSLEEHHQEQEEKVKTEDEEESKNNFALKEVDTTTIVFTDSECEPDKKKKNKPKHRKTMSVSNTIELVRSMGDEWIEAAKREIGEHSKKRENLKKKKEAGVIDANHITDKKHDKNHSNSPVEHNDNVVLLLSDATITEADELEVVETCNKICKKKDTKIKEMAPKICSSQIMQAQKMGVKMIAKASTVGALNFIRRKRPVPIVGIENNAVDHILLSTALFIDSERTHSDMVEVHREPLLTKKHDGSDVSVNSGDEIDGEIFYDAKATASQEESETADEEPIVKKTSAKSEAKKVAKQSADPKVLGLRSRKTFGGSLKRTGGGRRKVKRRSSNEEAPPLPPKGFVPPPPPPKPSHWLFGNSFKGEGRRDTDDSGADSSHHTDSSHLPLEHSLDIADNSKHSVRPRPVTKAESFRDRAAKVQRTKRKTSDPNQLTSGNAFNDAEGTGILGAPSGGSSSSSLSSRSNESAGPIDNQDCHLDASEEEESAEPWSMKAPAEILASMTPKARKRQDLIHELITSEVSHVRWLRILRQVFYNPLQQSSLLPPGELKALFPNLSDVLQRHRKLCSDLKTLSSASPVIKTKPLADALIMTLGESKYPGTLAKFCGGQRLALDALRERRRRAKELHTFLAKCEQDPLCARLRLQAFLACVWQRLTKYQLLLEGIIKIGKDDDEDDLQNSEDDGLTRLNKALEIAKEVLNTVNTTVKMTENVHRLKTIQSKLEVRGVGSSGSETEPGELKRLDLVRHSLVMEGTLSIRQDSTKRVTVLALLLEECLVLLQREADKFILRPIPQGTHQQLSPIIRWDTVFFRPNAAVKNGFFLVNMNGIQMYELSTPSSSEYNTWTKHISESAKALPRSGTVEEGPPPPLPANPPPTPIPSSDVISNGTSEPNTSIEEDKEEPPEPPKNEDDGKQISGAIQTVEGESNDTKGLSNINTIIEELIIPSSVAVVTPPVAFTAERLLTPEERLRQAEEKVELSLKEVADAAKETASSAQLSIYSAMESLIGKSPSGEQQRASIGNGLDHEAIQEDDVQLSTTHLLLMALTHVDNFTKELVKALRVSPTDCSMTRCTLHTGHGLCDTCSAQHSKHLSTVNESDRHVEEIAVGEDAVDPAIVSVCNTTLIDSQAEEKLNSIVLLEEVGESSTDPYITETEANLVTTSAIGLRKILTTLISRIPALEKEREFLRARLQQTDQRLHRLHHLHKDCVISENSSGSSIEDTIQEVPNSNSTDQSGGEG